MFDQLKAIPGVIEALIPAQNVSRIMLILQAVLQPDDQTLQTEDAFRVPPERLLANLVLGDLVFPVVRGVFQLHQILHVLPENVGAADLPTITGELVQILVRSRSSPMLLRFRRVSLRRRLGNFILTRFEGRTREGRQFRRQGRVVAVLVHGLRPGIVLLNSHVDRAGFRCEQMRFEQIEIIVLRKSITIVTRGYISC